jgi:hypothetical protein
VDEELVDLAGARLQRILAAPRAQPKVQSARVVQLTDDFRVGDDTPTMSI